jgi:putative transcriptional regulator
MMNSEGSFMPQNKRRFGDDTRIRESVGEQLIQGLTEFADALEAGNADQFTFHRVKLTIEPTSYSPQMVKDTRALLRASQAVFAAFLGVSPNAVRSWEQGRSQPSNMAGRFMDAIRSDPKYWVDRLKKMIESANRAINAR